MTMFLLCIAAVGGYVASIYTWDIVKGIFQSSEARIKSFEAKIASIRARL